MTAIIEFGLCGIRLKRAKLFGQHAQYPVTSIRFLFVSVVLLSRPARELFLEALGGLTRDGDWLVDNAQSVRLAKRKAAAKARAAIEADHREDTARAWAHVAALDRKNGELQNEVYALRRVIKGIQGEASA